MPDIPPLDSGEMPYMEDFYKVGGGGKVLGYSFWLWV